MADGGDRAALDLERRVGAELVARGIVAQTALGPLHAEGRARGFARGGSFLAGAVLARRLATAEVIDAVLRGSELEPGEATLTLAAPPPHDLGERTIAMTGPALALPTAPGPGPGAGATAWGDEPQAAATAWGAEPPTPGGLAGARVDATRLSLGDEAARWRPPAKAPTDQTFAPDLDGARTAADVPADGRTWMPFEGGPASVAPTLAPPIAPTIAPPGGAGSAGRQAAAPAARYALPDGLAPGPQRAIDQQLAREVTLHAGAPDDPEAIDRAARTLAQLDHPAVPRVHDVGLLQGRPYYTTDRLTGAPLGVGEAPPLPALLRAFLDVGAAVAHAHRAGVVHGSLAPERVVLGAAGEVWVTGWGEAPGTTPADDVQGLGRVLEGVLEAGRVGAPRALVAVTRAARRPDGATYATAEALVEDVRRFLDGKGVIADSESLPRALARLARRHPAPAAVVGAIALLLAGIAGLAGLGLRGAWLAAKSASARAEAAGEEADRQASAARTSAAAARESADAATARLRLQDALAQAQDAAARSDDLAPVTSAFAAAEREAEAMTGASRKDGLRRVRARRARWALDGSRPEEALADLGDEAADEEGLVLRFLAARRSPGAAADAAAARALAALGEGGGPLAEVARVLGQLAPLEAERARLDARANGGRSTATPALTEGAKPLVARLEEALVERPGLALAHEALGRALAVGPDPLRGCREFVVATQLDPADPEPRLRLVEVWQRELGNHDRRRWVAGWWRRQIAGATQLTRRPEPLLALARLTVTQNDRAGALAAAERLLALPRPAGGDPEAHAPWDEAELYAARARLELGQDPGPALARLAPGPGVEAPRLHALRAWAALRAGRHAEGLEAAQAALAGLYRIDAEPLRDVIEAVASSVPAMADDEWVPLYEALKRSSLGADEQAWAFDWVVLAQGRSMSLRGVYSHLDVVEESSRPGSYLHAEASLAEARVYLLSGFPPRAHLDALLAWAQVGLDRDDLRSTARDARALVVKVLRESGQEQAATRFEAIALEEPTTPRAWSP